MSLKSGLLLLDKLPLVQKRQAKLLEACGFKCEQAGTMNIAGLPVPMWKPTGEKTSAVCDLIGYGGAAYGGKTYGNLLLAMTAAILFPGVQIAFFRRTYAELDGPGAAMQTAQEIFKDVAKSKDGGREWRFANGSVLYFRYAQHEKDKYNYQSQQIDILLIDEATHFTWSIIDYLLTRNRATVSHYGFKPFAVLPSNPGNIGHVWYSNLFDVTGKYGDHETVKEIKNQNGKNVKVYFIPALLEDNQIGVIRDPSYEDRLMARDPEIARALRHGDWSVFAGQAFGNWYKSRIACASFDIPEHWPKWRAIDYGYVHPFVCAWLALEPRTGRIYIYRAIKKSELTDTQQAAIIRQMTAPDEHISFTYASPDMWARKTAQDRVFTSVDEYRREGVYLVRADNDRLSGKRKIDRMIAEAADGLPSIQIFEEFYNIFSCMETLVRKESNPEDVEKVDGDDAYDCLRYGLTNTDPPSRKKEDTSLKNPMKEYRML